MKKIILYLTLFIILSITLNLWIFSKPDLSILSTQPLRAVSQVLGLFGLVLMSLTLILSMKLKIIDRLFEGLDKAFFVHRILGSAAFIFILHHPLLLAIQALPQTGLSLMYILPGADLSYNLGIFSLLLMVLSFIFMVFIKLPFHIWKLTHQFLGLSFLLGGVHALMIAGDISAYFPLKIWIGFFIGTGSLSALYSIFLYKYFGPKFIYRVEKVERVLDIINIYLYPATGKTLSFMPGQFIYVKFNNKTLGSESHPFSISSSPHEGFLRISAKVVGDYTLKMSAITKGDLVICYGAYGKFISSNIPKQVIWIGGGVGVTPFLSMLRSKFYEQGESLVNFYYTYRNKEEGVFVNEIEQIASRIPQINFFNWCTEEKNRLSAQLIGTHTDLKSLDKIFICGPSLMMESLKRDFLGLGISEEKIIFEDFAFL